jgi:hypothetical protein
LNLGKIRSVNPRDVWNAEDRHFTPWLAENIELLADALKIKIEPDPRTEVQIGSFKADIIAKREGSESQILVENQLEETDHSHLGQLITYASGMDIETVVWIAPRFREEHRAAIDWLNSISESRVNFFGLQVEALRIDGSAPAPRLNIICRPNDWARHVRGITGPDEPERRVRRRAYWASFLGKLRAEGGKLSGNREPTRYNWLGFGIGKTGIQLVAYCRKDSARIVLELQRSESQPAIATGWFRALEEKRDYVESELGFELEWDVAKKLRTCRVLHEWADSPGWGDDAQWDEHHAVMARKLNRIHAVFAPLVKNL